MPRTFRRREPVPFAFVAEAERFRSNVTPPPPPRASWPERAGRALLGFTILAGFVGALAIGTPALQSEPQDTPPVHQSEASHGR